MMIHLRNIQTRLEELTNSWPEVLCIEFNKYINSNLTPPKSDANYDVTKNQLWYNLIIIFIRAFAEEEGDKEEVKSFLEDILWAQFCLLLTFRIKDDLYDGDIRSNSLIIASDQLLIESYRTYNKYFNGSESFWTAYFNSVETTGLTLILVDEMQQDKNTNPRNLLENYKDVLSIFNIGFKAICIKYKANEKLTNIIEVNNYLSIAGQILDDIKDIDEDLSRGRYNYVSLLLMNSYSEKKNKFGSSHEALLNNLFRKGKLSNVFDNIFELMNFAKVSAGILQIKKLNELILEYAQNINLLQKYYHECRVKLLFKTFHDFKESADEENN